MQKTVKLVYEGIMILLVMVTIVTIWTDNPYNSTINWLVWLVFVIDFFVRFLATKEKWNFIKQNPFLVIAIIPFDQFFQIARIVRLVHLFRLKAITKYYIVPHAKKLTAKTIMTIISLFLVLLVVESVVIWNLEHTVHTYIDAIYVIVGHLFFLGHQHFQISNPISIGALTITSITGIVIQGLALQWAFTKAESFVKRKKRPFSEETERRRRVK